ncbi:hypothetical protein F5Y15DRAFT_399126 [Xylariaceae sp. FL0016]|nr:hypothetical protein F5Y15DRAFT_399126 [Xylariaceae sp. FL0016]
MLSSSSSKCTPKLLSHQTILEIDTSIRTIHLYPFNTMAPTSEELRNIADQAEKDLNTYGAKTGAHKSSVNDEVGVDSRVENKFPGAKVQYGQDLSTNAGYNRRIPPEEGGDLDARGRQTRGEHFEGIGGPEHKLAQQAREYGGNDTFDSTGKRQHDVGSRNAADTSVPVGKEGDMMTAGKEAVQSNIEGTKHLPRKENFKGADYYTPESVPGSISAEGYEPPSSVTESSREAERYV